MTTLDRSDNEMGQFALALVLEDFKRRVEQKETTEQDVAELMDAALGRFPPDFATNVRSFLASRDAK